ncbi:MAG: patatin-like phospholipase family protein [Byssovorax sp.]
MNILSIDGGVSASLHARVLRQIEEARPGFLAATDLFAGTSDGAFAALYLASRPSGTPADSARALGDCVEMLHEILAIFRVSPSAALRVVTGRSPRALADAMRATLERHLGGETLGDLAERGRKVAVVSIRRKTWKRKVFKSFDFESDAERRRTLVDVALSSAAFPVVLAEHRSEVDGEAYLDGALLANNPTLVAVRAAMDHLALEGASGRDLLKELAVLSFGATEAQGDKSGEGPGRGLLERLPRALDRLGFAGWTQLLARPLYFPDFMIQSSVDVIDVQCRALLEDRYRRIRPAIPELDYILSVFASRDWLRGRLDRGAQGEFGAKPADLGWVSDHWLAPR